MKLAAQSQFHIQNFFRAYLGDQAFELPSILIYRNRFAHLITGVCRVGAITFGRRVFVAPAFIMRDESKRLITPGWLVAHEAMHVLQYKQRGSASFLVRYVYGFWRALRKTGRWDKAARMTAYLDIAEECAAREVEEAYCAWSTKEKEVRSQESGVRR